MIIKFTTAILLISISSIGQIKKLDCKKELNKVPYLVSHNFNESNSSLQNDRDIFMHCGNMDSIDIELINGAVLGPLIVQLSNNNKKITYGLLLSRINEFKKTEAYTLYREGKIITKTLEKKIVTLDGFEKDKDLLTKIGFTSSEIDSFKIFIQSQKAQSMTYKEAFTKFYKLKSESH